MLNKIRIVNTYVLVFAVLFLLQKYTLGFIPGFKAITVFRLFYLQDFVFIASSILFIAVFVTVDTPKKAFSISSINRA